MEKKPNRPLTITLRRMLNARSPDPKATTIPIHQPLGSDESTLDRPPASDTSSMAAPKIAGRERRKEKVKASSRERPALSPVTMVDPDLDMPGKTARPWAMPTLRADGNDRGRFAGEILLP